MIDYVLHWVNNIHYLIFSIAIFVFTSILFNPLLWIPFIIYSIYVFISYPSYIEIDIYRRLRNILYPIIKSIHQHYKHNDKYIVHDIDNIKLLNTPAIYGFHPHGLASITRALFCSNQSSELYEKHLKDAYHAIHSFLFKVPILRDILLLGGAIPVSESYIRHYLSKGHSITITPGGAREMKYAQDKYHKDGETYYIIPRKGIARIASSMNVPMVPIYTDGERQLMTYNHPPLIFNIINKITNIITKKTSDTNILQILHPSNISRWHSLFNTTAPITTTYIGQPTNTYDKYIDELKSLCKKANTIVKEIHLK